MAGTYCGKDCLDCQYREPTNCPGCKAGPGKSWGNDCELARCVRSKGHDTCETCSFRENCGTFRCRERAPEYRRKKAEAAALQQAERARRAPILGKWLWMLFWLVIPSTVASLLTNNSIAGLVPGLLLPGQILSAAVSVAYGLILLRLAAEEARYKTAGICVLVAGGISALTALLPAEAAPAELLLTLPGAAVSMVAVYQEFMGHAEILSCVDGELSASWESLWKWYIGLYGAIFGSMILVILFPVLGLIAVLLACVGMIIVDILRLVFLYRTAKTFRDYGA